MTEQTHQATADTTGVAGRSDAEIEQLCIRNLLAASDEVIYFKDLQSRFIRVSAATAALHGRTPEQMVGLTDFDLFAEEHATVAFADEQHIIATGTPIANKEEQELWEDRESTWVASTKLPLRDADGTIIGTFGISRDITRRVRAEQEAQRIAEEHRQANIRLHRLEAELRAVLETSPDAIAKFDRQHRYRYLNPACAALFPDGGRNALGKTDREAGSMGPFLEEWERNISEVLATGEIREMEHRREAENGEERWYQTQMAPERDQEGTVVGVIASTREITALKRAEKALAHQALHDPLTGLANRLLLKEHLARALRRLNRRTGRVALMFIDLDKFKEVNDVHGHEVGDRVLVEAAHRLQELARSSDTVARFGGDEFVILFDDVGPNDDVPKIAGRVVAALRRPFRVGELELSLSGSVGVVTSDDPTMSPGDLIRDADVAMYRAKAGGRDRLSFHEAGSQDQVVGRLRTEADLYAALDRGQLRLVYQPVFTLADRRMVGVEALIRWEHPELGTLLPDAFIGIAESRGLIVPIGTWVLDEACRQLAAWNSEPGSHELTMAVNVSGHQLVEADFVDVVAKTLHRHGIRPELLCLEVSDASLRGDREQIRSALQAAADLGVHIALDDFGTGYASLEQLRDLPVDVLKIDRTFLESMESSDRGRGVVDGLVAMAHVLGINPVAEGIETADQLSHLASLGCADGQGFLLARPLPPAEVSDLRAETVGQS